jgi:hypothetical protein
MHTAKNKINPIRIEPANQLRPDDSTDLKSPEKSIFSPSNMGATLNLKKLSVAHNQLDTSFISGSQKVKLNIGKISAVRQKFLSTLD